MEKTKQIKPRELYKQQRRNKKQNKTDTNRQPNNKMQHDSEERET
jgi:hypothetical protein